MRDLQGTRAVVVAGVLAVALADLADALLLFFGATGPNVVHPADGPVIVLYTAGALALLAGLILWLRGATQNQARLGVPVEGSVWTRAVLGLLLPLVGVVFLFQLAARLLDASGRAAGRPHHLGAWFGLWVVAYLALDLTALSTWLDLGPEAAVALGTALFALLALPGLHRFLRTIEAAQEQANGVVREAVPARTAPE